MLPPADALALRKTVIANEAAPDDYVVIWNGLKIGRVLKVTAVGGGPCLELGRVVSGTAAAAGASGARRPTSRNASGASRWCGRVSIEI